MDYHTLGVEHLLLGLARAADPMPRDVLESHGIHVDALRPIVRDA